MFLSRLLNIPGVVFAALSGEALVHYVEEIATHCPGYSQWCCHQHEIRKRAEDWASAAESYYWALGTTPKRGRAPQGDNNIVCFNRKRAEDAQSRIKAAVAELQARDELPAGMTARMKAIAPLAKCSFTTLQKYKELWHPQESVIAPTEAVSTTLSSPSETSTQAPKAASPGELHTVSFMKGEALAPDQPLSKPQLDRKGEGTGRGDESFPQAELPLSETTIPPSLSRPRITESNFSELKQAFESHNLSDVTARIRHQIKHLGWTLVQVQEFIADNFQGKRWAHLSESELPLLSYWLWQVNSGEC